MTNLKYILFVFCLNFAVDAFVRNISEVSTDSGLSKDTDDVTADPLPPFCHLHQAVRAIKRNCDLRLFVATDSRRPYVQQRHICCGIWRLKLCLINYLTGRKCQELLQKHYLTFYLYQLSQQVDCRAENLSYSCRDDYDAYDTFHQSSATPPTVPFFYYYSWTIFVLMFVHFTIVICLAVSC